MSTPAAVEPPTPENVHLYRAAVLAWRKAEIEECSRHVDVRLANPHVAEYAAARAVLALARLRRFDRLWLLKSGFFGKKAHINQRQPLPKRLQCRPTLLSAE